MKETCRSSTSPPAVKRRNRSLARRGSEEPVNARCDCWMSSSTCSAAAGGGLFCPSRRAKKCLSTHRLRQGIARGAPLLSQSNARYRSGTEFVHGDRAAAQASKNAAIRSQPELISLRVPNWPAQLAIRHPGNKPTPKSVRADFSCNRHSRKNVCTGTEISSAIVAKPDQTLEGTSGSKALRERAEMISLGLAEP